MPPQDVPSDALELHESTLVIEEGGSPIQPDGTVLMHIIRPGKGKGKGNHYYSPEMLRENAHKFEGWRMFVDHLSPEAKKKQGGLPRSIRDLGGRIVESWFDPNVPADDRHEQGSVMGRCKPVRFVRDIIEDDPSLVEASISATATAVKPKMDGNQRMWAVEGIEDKGSVDWVTEAGAGGKVVSIMESAYDDSGADEVALLESMDAEALADYISEERPELADLLAEAKAPPFKKKGADAEDAEDAKDGGKDEAAEGEPAGEDDEEKLKKKGLPPALAKKAAAKAKAAQESNAGEGEEMPEITPELLTEALQGSPELRGALAGSLSDAIEQGVAERLPALVEAAVEEERELLRAETRADSDRQVQLRDMRDDAARLVREARLPETWQAEIISQFDITEAGPTPALDQVDEIDGEGKVVKRAPEKVVEAVQEQIAKARKLIAEANPTRVRNQGPSGPVDGEGGEGGEKKEPKQGALTESVLQEAGFEKGSDPWADPALAIQS